MKKWMKRILIIAITMVYITPISATTLLNKAETEKYLNKVSNYITEKITTPTYGSVGGEWAVMGLARYGNIGNNYKSIYKENLRKKLKECNGKLSEIKYTEYARVAIALTAIGENPKDFYGYNLIKPLAELDHVKVQGANGIIYALIALDCGSYEIPKPDSSYEGDITTREKLIELILNAELSDGGWAYSGKVANADMTAMTIQALCPYYSNNSRVKKAVDRGLNVLSDLQLQDGSYATGRVKTCESTAQVLTALSEMHINIRDKRFVKGGNTILDGLLQYYQTGGFCHLPKAKDNQMATEQAMYAMVSYYRSIAGKNRLYQMSDAKTINNNTTKSTANKKKSASSIKHNKKQPIKKDSNKNQKNNPTIEKTTKKINSQEKAKNKKKKKPQNSEETILETNSSGETIVSQTKKESKEEKADAKNQNSEGKAGMYLVIILLAAGITGAIVIRTRQRGIKHSKKE